LKPLIGILERRKTIEVHNNVPFEIGNKVAIPVNVMHGDLQVLVIALMILPI
jgi:hypothetical protein